MPNSQLAKSYASYTTSRLSLALKGAVSTHILRKTVRLKSDSPESSAAIAAIGDETTNMESHVKILFSLHGHLTDTLAGVSFLTGLMGAAGLTSVIPLISECFYLPFWHWRFTLELGVLTNINSVLIVIAIRRIAKDRTLRDNQRSTNNSRIAALSRFLPFLRDTKIVGLEPTLTAFIRGVQLSNLQARETDLRHWVTGHILRKAHTFSFNV